MDSQQRSRYVELLRDYIVVGFGIAGLCFCEHLERNSKSFIVFDDDSQQSSWVAGGMYNPVILKRFTLAWNAVSQQEFALPFYRSLEAKLNESFLVPLKVYRKFASIEEQNLWFEAMDKPQMDQFMSSKILQNENPHVKASYGFGQLEGVGRLKVRNLITAYRKRLEAMNSFVFEQFDFDQLQFQDNVVSYKGYKAKQIVFATGYGLKSNPLFKELPLQGTKGELVLIEAADLKLEAILKAGVFLLPLGDDRYYVGATYNWNDKTNKPSEKAKKELLSKLDKLIVGPYKVIDQIAGIRPTVIDRRPLVGRHLEHQIAYVLNGMGTRGVLVAPTLSKQLYEYIEEGSALDLEIDVQRFYNKA